MIQRLNIQKSLIHIIYKILMFCMVLVALTPCLLNCAGLSDWEYELPNDYCILRLNGADIIIAKKSDDGYSYSNVTERYISCFAYNDKYICAKRFELSDDIKQEEILKMDIECAKYCIINTETHEVYDFLTEEQYKALCYELNITDLCEWINTYPAP